MAVDDTVMGSKPRFEISTLISFDVTTKPPRVDEICTLLFGFSLLKDCVFCRVCSENVVSYENAVHEAGHIMEETFVFLEEVLDEVTGDGGGVGLVERV